MLYYMYNPGNEIKETYKLPFFGSEFYNDLALALSLPISDIDHLKIQ